MFLEEAPSGHDATVLPQRLASDAPEYLPVSRRSERIQPAPADSTNVQEHANHIANAILRMFASQLHQARSHEDALLLVVEQMGVSGAVLITRDNEHDEMLLRVARVKSEANLAEVDVRCIDPLLLDAMLELAHRTADGLPCPPLPGLLSGLLEDDMAGADHVFTRPLLLDGVATGALMLLGVREPLSAARLELFNAMCDALAVAIGNEELHVREVESIKASIVATLSHELRTPLTSIVGFAEVLADGDTGPLNDEQRGFVEIIGTSALRLQQQLENLLTLTRLNDGTLSLHRHPLRIEDALQAALGRAKPRAAARQITLDMCIAQALPEVYGDPWAFDTAVNHLLDNAIKFSPLGGSVYVNVSRVGGHVIIEVANSGTYITPEERLHLFTAFYRTPRAERDVVQGSGLGLTITKSLIERQGGKIWVESSPDLGTMFYFALPSGHRPRELRRLRDQRM